MSRPIVFIDYQRPRRTRSTALEALGAFVIAAALPAAFVYLVPILAPNLGDDLTNAAAIAVLLVVIVSFVWGCGSVWSMIRGGVEETQVTDQGVRQNGRHWPWECVTKITVYRPGPQSISCLFTVERDYRSLAILVPINDDDPEKVIADLESFVANNGYEVQWISRG